MFLPIRDYIRRMLSLGKKTADIWQLIKSKPQYRSITNANLNKAFDAVNKNTRAAKELNKVKAATPIKKVIPGGSKRSSKVRIDFTFRFTYPSGSSSGKVGREKTYMSLSINPNATKGEVNEVIRKQIREWIAEHYQDSEQSTGRIDFNINYIS